MPRVRRKSADGIYNQRNRIYALGTELANRTRQLPQSQREERTREITGRTDRATRIADRYAGNIGRRQGIATQGRIIAVRDYGRRYTRNQYMGTAIAG